MISKFHRVAEAELILKLLEACPNSPLPRKLFNYDKYSSEGKEDNSIGKEINMLRLVSAHIFENPQKYQFDSIALAANFLSEQHPAKFSPLLNEEKILGIS